MWCSKAEWPHTPRPKLTGGCSTVFLIDALYACTARILGEDCPSLQRGLATIQALTPLKTLPSCTMTGRMILQSYVHGRETIMPTS